MGTSTEIATEPQYSGPHQLEDWARHNSVFLHLMPSYNVSFMPAFYVLLCKASIQCFSIHSRYFQSNIQSCFTCIAVLLLLLWTHMLCGFNCCCLSRLRRLQWIINSGLLSTPDCHEVTGGLFEGWCKHSYHTWYKSAYSYFVKLCPVLLFI